MCRVILFLLGLGISVGVQALDLRVALGVQDVQVAQRAGASKNEVQGGGLTAFNEDLAREICRRMSARCITSNLEFAEILPGIEAQKFELGFGNFLRTPAREERVAFSDSIWRSSSRLVALSQTAQHFAAQQGRDVALDRLREARIVAIADSQQFLYLQTLAAENRLTLIAAKTMADIVVLLRTDKADFCLLPVLSAYALIGREAPGQFEFFGPAEARHGLGGSVHIALPKGDEALRLGVNKAIAALRADGSYHRIVRRYFPFSLD